VITLNDIEFIGATAVGTGGDWSPNF